MVTLKQLVSIGLLICTFDAYGLTASYMRSPATSQTMCRIISSNLTEFLLIGLPKQ